MGCKRCNDDREGPFHTAHGWPGVHQYEPENVVGMTAETYEDLHKITAPLGEIAARVGEWAEWVNDDGLADEATVNVVREVAGCIADSVARLEGLRP